jgi:hypothetical protein
LAGGDLKVRETWSWMVDMKAQSISGRTVLGGKDYALLGIEEAILDGSHKPSSIKEEIADKSIKESITLTSYVSEFRTLALRICGWDFDAGEMSLEKILMGYVICYGYYCRLGGELM